MTARAARLLTKLSSTGRVDLSAVGRDTSNSALTGSDIAAAVSLAKLPRVEYLFVLFVHAQQKELERELIERLQIIADAYIAGRGFIYAGNKETWIKIRNLAIDEATKPARCKVCRGTKELATGITAKPIPCEACNATGRKMATGDDRAEVIGVTKNNWNVTYRSRYEMLYRMIMAILASGMHKVDGVI